MSVSEFACAPLTLTDTVSAEDLLQMYVGMVRIRRAEERIAELIEAGEIGTPCHLYIGQEAIAVGTASALKKIDYVWGGHRSHGHYLAKGGNLAQMMAEIYCKRTGCSYGRGGSMHLFAKEVGILGTVPLVGATIPLAVGAGLAAKLRGDDAVSVAYFGDGAVEEGGFHESMNLAAVYNVPVVFVCENNFFASHLGLLERRTADNIWELANAHGMNGERVDGNDVVAVFEAMQRATTRARSSGGPTMLECRTFRWRGHVGPRWDMDVGVKRRDELHLWLPRDPIGRAEAALRGAGIPDDALDARRKEIDDEIEAAVTFARESPPPGVDELLQHVFCSNEESR